MISATDPVRRVARDRAAAFGTNPRTWTASSTATLRRSATRVSPLTTRETVARETPASRATVSRVGVRRVAGSGTGSGSTRLVVTAPGFLAIRAC